MKFFQRYISFIFLKNFLIIFFSLQIFYLLIDVISNIRDVDTLPLKILYLSFSFLDAINYTIFLSLIFAMIVTKMYMIKSHELVALYTFGISKNDVIKPIFLISIAVVLGYIGAKFTSFSYAAEYKRNIIKNSSLSNSSENLFIKYFDKYIYIKKLNPLKQEAQDIRIFEVKDGDLLKITKSNKATFKNDGWLIDSAIVTTKPEKITLGNSKLEIKKEKNIRVLEGFKPKIMDNIFDTDGGYSLLDAYTAFWLYSEQGFDTNKLRGLLYQILFFPFFVPMLSLIMFYYLPAGARFASLAFVGFVMIFVTLCVWAMLFFLSKISFSGAILPEVATILPIFLLSIIATYLYRKNQ